MEHIIRKQFGVQYPPVWMHAEPDRAPSMMRLWEIPETWMFVYPGEFDAGFIFYMRNNWSRDDHVT